MRTTPDRSGQAAMPPRDNNVSAVVPAPTASLEPTTRPLVFASVGTDHHPFNRLVTWVDSWARRRADVEVLIQYGEASAPSFAEAVPYLSHTELFGHISRASVVVSHGGPATIAEAWRAGLVPLVLPRGHRLGEHVDDHQQAFSAVLAARDHVVEIRDEAHLFTALDRAMSDPTWLRRPAGPALDIDATIDRFATVVDGVIGRARGAARPQRSAAYRRTE